MTDQERKAIIALIEKVRKKTGTMSPDQARQRLADEGICDEKGRLTTLYGGRATARV